MLVVAVGVLLLGGCTSSPSGSSGQSTSGRGGGTRPSTLPTTGGAVATTVESTPASTPPVGPVVALGDADKGKTVNVGVGQQVTVTLTGADWRFVDPTPATVLTPSSPPVVGNGTTSISYRGAKPGTATATASRGNDSYQIIVIVH